MPPSALLLAGLALGQPTPTDIPADPPGVVRIGRPTADGPLGVPRVLPRLPDRLIGQAPAGKEPPPATPPRDDAKAGPVPETLNVPVTVAPAPTQAAAEAAATPAADRWAFMRAAQGSWLGVLLDDNRTSFSGWVEGSYTGSTTRTSNAPVVWNDRADKFLLNQLWARLERSVVTTGTTDPTFGYRVDLLAGSDYRFSLPRGLFNSQLESSRGLQNLYGVDPIQFYANAYLPNLFQGTDVRAGRLFTPFGYESLEGISTPLGSRSYAFNFCPPFTHMGVMVSPTFSPTWSGKFMIANGNDVFFDPSQETRFVGAVTYTSPDKRDTVTFGTSIGRGKFDAGDAFAPSTAALPNEPAGRNNINVFDLVWSHGFSSRLTYATEFIYGYQSNVPANVPGGIVALDRTEGTAHWGSWVQYLNYTFNDKVTGIVRFELFDDFQGQRTGFEGLYTAITVGAQYRPRKDVVIRPEIRYDTNNYTRPFDGNNNILTAAIDFIVRY